MAAVTKSAERAAGSSVRADVGRRVAFYVLLIMFSLFFLLPLVWMVVTAIKPFAEWVQPNWIPKEPTFQNFSDIFQDPTLPVRRWFVNSMGIAAVFTIATLVIDAMAAYAYARMDFRGKNALFALLLATLVMPGIMFLVPNFITVARLNWLGSYQGVIAPGLAGVFGVFFLRQFFQGIPRELEEAALIDGASIWTTFTRVVLPLASGALATLGVITFMTSCNYFLWPLLILCTEREMLTLPVVLATLQ